MSTTEKSYLNHITNRMTENQGKPKCLGVDLYNQEITGEIAVTLTAACGGTTPSGGKVLIEVEHERDNAE